MLKIIEVSHHPECKNHAWKQKKHFNGSCYPSLSSVLIIFLFWIQRLVLFYLFLTVCIVISIFTSNTYINTKLAFILNITFIIWIVVHIHCVTKSTLINSSIILISWINSWKHSWWAWTWLLLFPDFLSWFILSL